MIYSKIKQGIFLDRPNRFIALVSIDGYAETCHVKNTGRCKELLLPGATVYVNESKQKGRKTKYDLVSVIKGDKLINIDSQAPNKVVFEWLQKGNLFEKVHLIQPEKRYLTSRFDFYVETETEQAFLEVKGVTLEEKGIVSFPDAPTTRGIKHIYELMHAMEQGYNAYIIFVIQMKDVLYFAPNEKMHPEFAAALQDAKKHGVTILAYDCFVDKISMKLRDEVEVKL